MSKYELLPEQLLHEGTITLSNIFHPVHCEDEDVVRVHDPVYVTKLKDLNLSPAEVRRTGFPLTRELIEREWIIMNGTIQCVHFALENGIAMNIAGGTHHAFTNRGEGFCLLNDQAIGARHVLNRGYARKVLIVDLDVHQGNGTAQIFRDDPCVFTFSMHGQHNYPLIKEKSDLDVGLPDFTNDKSYLSILDTNLKKVMDTFQPDFIFYQSGVDILDTDKLGRLSVTKMGCRQRDELVISLAFKNKIPLVASMGGGYSPNFRDIIEAHANTFRVAQDIFF
jgi:acetoin utilization deacetylase AcuC-like enzyme